LRPPKGFATLSRALGSGTHSPSTTKRYSCRPGARERLPVQRPLPERAKGVFSGFHPLKEPATKTVLASGLTSSNETRAARGGSGRTAAGAGIEGLTGAGAGGGVAGLAASVRMGGGVWVCLRCLVFIFYVFLTLFPDASSPLQWSATGCPWRRQCRAGKL
jgi:hypothetical protein